MGSAVLTVLLTGVIAGLASLVGAGSAAAHNTLVSADPADGARLAAGPERITLTFDQPVNTGFTTVTVTGPDRTNWRVGQPTVSGNTVTTPVDPLGPAGEYLIGYRIVSADGHPVSGSVSFRLTTAGTGTPAPPASDDAGNGDGAAGAGPAAWVWVAGAVLLLAGGVLAGLWLGRRPPRRGPAG